MKPRFDDCDLAVYDAHAAATHPQTKNTGGVRTWELQRHHDGALPVQRLTGMARRGLLTYDGFRWALTDDGLRLAERHDRHAATEPSRNQASP